MTARASAEREPARARYETAGKHGEHARMRAAPRCADQCRPGSRSLIDGEPEEPLGSVFGGFVPGFVLAGFDVVVVTDGSGSP